MENPIAIGKKCTPKLISVEKGTVHPQERRILVHINNPATIPKKQTLPVIGNKTDFFRIVDKRRKIVALIPNGPPRRIFPGIERIILAVREYQQIPVPGIHAKEKSDVVYK
jgi:hypothetical protein